MYKLLLEGGAEFGGHMSEPDLRAIELAGGFDVPICIIPTAAAPDRNHVRAGNNGMRWFQSLGAVNVFSAAIIDHTSANDAGIAATVRASRLIYLLGGFPRYLAETLSGSLCWQSVMEVARDGAVIAGSSAGAMVLCEHYYDPHEKRLLTGLNLIPNACVLPHYNTFGRSWAAHLSHILPDVNLIGIDERTGMVTADGVNWQALGLGGVVIQTGVNARVYRNEARFVI